MLGFRYKGLHSSAFKIIAKTVNRPILPALRRRELTIPGIHGAYDFGDNIYEKRLIEMQIQFVENTFNDLRHKAGNIAVWLSNLQQAQPLIFDDEPDKYYLAKVYDSVPLENLFTVGTGRIVFECQPFKYVINTTGYDPKWQDETPLNSYVTWNGSLNYTFNFDGAGQTATIENFGTIATRPVITITGSFTTLSIVIYDDQISVVRQINYTESSSSGSIIIDSEKYTIKKGSTNKLPVCTGNLDKFFELMPGINTLEVGGLNLSISVLVDFRATFL